MISLPINKLCVGKYIMPGGIDLNVHLQRPGFNTQTIDDFYQVSAIQSWMLSFNF